ncbi:MAG: L,D-transpeptidase [Rhizobacter sp.]
MLCATAWAGVLAADAPASEIPSVPPAPAAADVPGLSPDARDTLAWIQATADHGHLPFAIVDKRQARVHVFRADGHLAGESPALLGLTPGDEGVPGAGQRVASLTPAERTTPAGRFPSEPGHNLTGEDIVWVDYDAAIAIHRVRPGPSRERREQRLASDTPADNRISLGCIVVPVAFYEQVVSPVLGRSRGVVYVLPEREPALAMLSRR